ncbi:MAG: acetyl-CoA carboxylase biotin carboxyl carrier protein [Hydromonas sp.]|nr:acetyl-CoA carboxylase biotin carboxyl carrier protein [Hydromonas sp.]
MDLRKLKTLIDLVSESEVSELEITEAEGKVRIVKGGGTVMMQHAPQQMMAAPAMSAPAAPATAVVPTAPAAPAQEAGTPIKSPMVGTYYAASAPGAAPYVTVGASVKKGQTLCIIEAMKLLNEIEAECDGVVKQILVDNAEPVEYGQVLFVIG